MKSMTLQEEKELVLATVERIFMIVSKQYAGADKKHQPGEWLNETVEENVLRGARHCLSEFLIRCGFQKPDNDNHLYNAMMRLIFAAALGHAQTMEPNVQRIPSWPDTWDWGDDSNG